MAVGLHPFLCVLCVHGYLITGRKHSNDPTLFPRALRKNPIKKEHFFDFMGKLLSNGHAERAPVLRPTEECWYLPIFGVYHPRKPGQVRVVFDFSVVFEGLSLNSVLLQGSDFVNNLQGVLMRFRKDKVAVIGDIEQMFYSFSVHEIDRNLLRFLWYKDNNPLNPLVVYRMCKHVFGNSPSSAIATYGLRKSVEKSDQDVQSFVSQDFYVDDGLTSKSTVEGAVDLLLRTQSDLSKSRLRLHKIASNVPEVMKSFPPEDLSKDLKDLDLDREDLPSQRSLGIVWNISLDKFVFKADLLVQPVTKRGILSTINSIFDPLGFLAPVVLDGRLILRELMSSKVDWDDCVPEDIAVKWERWRQRLHDLEILNISRSYFDASLSQMDRVELHLFSDASVNGISAVVYVQGYTTKGDKVVLGYICNRSKRFYTYVSNRVQNIINVSKPEQWNFVPSEKNPADIGSRRASVTQLSESSWLTGPQFLLHETVSNLEHFPLVSPEQDQEVRKEVLVRATNVVDQKSSSSMFQRFSTWQSLIRAVSNLRHISVSYHKNLPCKGWHICSDSKDVACQQGARFWVLQTVQREVFAKEVKLLSENQRLNKDSSLLSLDPVLHSGGMLHVGGRLGRSELPTAEKHPIILPRKHQVSLLLVRHYHISVFHQGRLFTEGALRSAGFWVVGAKRLVASVIHNCVIAKSLEVILPLR
ncbi:uncharacterized protein LOC128241385 [Mya arenaria]|uniref:uncharacterized protein LOC128241385 n=1 Tax=Mya arenaria TaxID=6604 RepID=UPI0022E0F094|nr:uncharacterized protein LOC128241385 [Mya arenaria]